MKPELTPELMSKAACGRHSNRYSEDDGVWDTTCQFCAERMTLVREVVEIVARKDAEIAEQQRLQAEHEIECTEGIEYSQAQWRGSEIAARIIKKLILSSWGLK